MSPNDMFTGIATVVALAAFVNSVRNSRAIDRQKYYSDLDSLYLRVLELGVANPGLIDPAKTADYQKTFAGNDLNRYDAYAFISWNVCETIFDTCRGDKVLWETWCPVIRAEHTLHGDWLRNNHSKFKPGFVKGLNFI